MKQFLILTVLLLTSFFATAQNGGQFYQNNVIRVEYLSYSAGTHTFKIVNKQTCEVRIRTKADTDAAVDINVAAGDSFYVNVFRGNPGNVKFRVKAETSCPSFVNPDMGWLELNTAGFTLNLVEGNNIVIVRGPNKLDLSINGGILKSSYGSLNYIEHIKIYSIMGNVKYDEVIFARRSNITDLNNYLKIGLNIVEVIIVDDNGPEHFVFKYMNPAR